jgi:hypothetical protein
MCAYNSNTPETGGRGWRVQDEPELHNEILSQKKKERLMFKRYIYKNYEVIF